MSDRDEVIPLLRKRLLDTPDLFTIQWHGKPVPPDTSTPYIEEQIVLGNDFDTGPAVRGVRWRRYDGVYQLTVCIPQRGAEVADALAMVTKIVNTFLEVPGPRFSSGATLEFTSTQVLSPRQPPSWLKIPVVINYTFTTNA